MKKDRRIKGMIASIIAICAISLIGCTKMDEDYKTNTNTGQKGIIIVNPDKIVK